MRKLRRSGLRPPWRRAARIPDGLRDVPKMTEGIAIEQPDGSTAAAYIPEPKTATGSVA